MRNIIKNKYGISLVEVMIAAGIMGAIAMGTAKMMGQQQKAATSMDRDFDARQIQSDIFTLLSNEENCRATFGLLLGDTKRATPIIQDARSKFSSGTTTIDDLVHDSDLATHVSGNEVIIADVGTGTVSIPITTYTGTSGGTAPGTAMGAKLKLNNSYTGNFYQESTDSNLVIFAYYFNFIKIKNRLAVGSGTNEDTKALGGKGTKYYAIKIAAVIDGTLAGPGTGSMITCKATGGNENSMWQYRADGVSGIYNNTGDVKIGDASTGTGNEYKLEVVDSGGDDEPVLSLEKTAAGQTTSISLLSNAQRGTITYDGTANNIEISTNGPNASLSIDGNGTTSIRSNVGNLALDSNGGTVQIIDNLTVMSSNKLTATGTSEFTGLATFNGGIDVVGTIDATAFQGGTFAGTNFTASGTFHATSDRRAKKNIKNVKFANEKLNALNGVSFNWKKNNRGSYGVIAQDVEKVFPELVQTDKQGKKSVNYDGLIGPMIEAIKEQNRTITKQQKLIEQLNERLETLENHIEAE